MPNVRSFPAGRRQRLTYDKRIEHPLHDRLGWRAAIGMQRLEWRVCAQIGHSPARQRTLEADLQYR